MQLTAEPVIESHGGTVVKFEADNCFAMFDDSLSAVRCGIGLNLAFDAANIVTPVELDIHVSVGIDRGRVLVVDHYLEFFGNAVNCASKLGEDGARPGEVLITKARRRELPAVDAQVELEAAQDHALGDRDRRLLGAVPQGAGGVSSPCGAAVVRLGTPRAADEGLRLGTVRRPPRGVRKAELRDGAISTTCGCRSSRRARRWSSGWFAGPLDAETLGGVRAPVSGRDGEAGRGEAIALLCSCCRRRRTFR